MKGSRAAVMCILHVPLVAGFRFGHLGFGVADAPDLFRCPYPRR
jgi:hypothetical protein